MMMMPMMKMTIQTVEGAVAAKRMTGTLEIPSDDERAAKIIPIVPMQWPISWRCRYCYHRYPGWKWLL